VAAFAIRKLDEIPSIEEGGVHWKPLQRYFGLTAFGANIYGATGPGQELIGEHDELSGGHEELYVVLDGVVRFTVNGENHHCERGDIVVVRDPSFAAQRLRSPAAPRCSRSGTGRRRRSNRPGTPATSPASRRSTTRPGVAS